MRPALEGNPHGLGRAGVAYIICNSANYRNTGTVNYEGIFGTADTGAVCGLLTTAPSLAANNWGKVTGGTTNIYTGLASNALRQNVDNIFANFGLYLYYLQSYKLFQKQRLLRHLLILGYRPQKKRVHYHH